MTGFELWTSGVGSDRSTKWATTTAPDGFLKQESDALDATPKIITAKKAKHLQHIEGHKGHLWELEYDKRYSTTKGQTPKFWGNVGRKT